MGITKQYLRINAGSVFGVIGSAGANVQFVTLRNTKTRYAIAAACENVILWDTKTGNKTLTFKGEKHEVSSLRVSPDREHIAVGYTDGVVRIFNLFTAECSITFSGHKSAVTCLTFDNKGMILASGSKDTEIVVWDIVSQSGMFRLRGHKGIITQLHFMKDNRYLASSSKDTFIKFWDLNTQHCFKTLTGHRSEVWDFVLVNNDTRLFSGSADSEIRAWDLVFQEENEQQAIGHDLDDLNESPAKRKKLDDDSDDADVLKCIKVGSIMRRDKDRLVGLNVDPSGRILACHGNSATLELFLLRSKSEIEKRMQKRMKKMRKKVETKTELEIGEENSSAITFTDEIKRLNTLKNSGKIKSVNICIEKDEAKFLSLLHNNCLEIRSVDLNEDKSESKAVSSLIHSGHRTDARTVSFSSDNIAILTASAESVKIWNRASEQCIRTMPCEYALCSAFLPGDRHCIVGTKTGKIQLFDIASGDLLENIEAHQGAVYSISISHDQRSFVSGGADKEVKFWELELINDESFSTTSKRLTAAHTRTFQVPEEILCIKLSPNGRLLAVALLDSTVKVFFVDTLKFFLSLYGHKLPVLSVDISSDSTLIVTGSADKNVKIWGLDFGDCHKSIFAHDDSITSVQFIPKTHMFVTGGKDNLIKQWDADNYQKIMTLNGHQGGVWALAVSPDSQHIASVSRDKSVRLWDKSSEPLILEEEQQLEREAEEDKAIIHDDSVIPGEVNPETGLAGKKTVETIKSAEKLIEGIDIYNEETEKLRQYNEQCKQRQSSLPKPDVHLLMVAYNQSNPEKFMLEVLKRIKSSELEEALLVLPFNYVIDLLKILNVFLSHSWEVELSLKCLLFLFRVHHGQVSMNSNLLPVLDNLRTVAQEQVEELKDTIGFNLAGLQYMQREVEAREEVLLFADATDKFKKKRKFKKKSRAVLTVS